MVSFLDFRLPRRRSSMVDFSAALSVSLIVVDLGRDGDGAFVIPVKEGSVG
jgi:hypothetical protein